MHLDCQNRVSSELICELSWNSQRILKGEDQLTKRQYLHTNINTTTAIFTSSAVTNAPITNSIPTTCKVKSIKMKISRSI